MWRIPLRNTVSVIRTATNAVMTTVPVTWAPDGVAIAPDGAFAYVVNEFRQHPLCN